jgi:hypothetical protein
MAAGMGETQFMQSKVLNWFVLFRFGPSFFPGSGMRQDIH